MPRAQRKRETRASTLRRAGQSSALKRARSRRARARGPRRSAADSTTRGLKTLGDLNAALHAPLAA
eukprot:2079363-Pyramimonas_sp.AAC.1